MCLNIWLSKQGIEDREGICLSLLPELCRSVYTSARSMGNKQEELEAIIQQDGYDLVAITEM